MIYDFLCAGVSYRIGIIPRGLTGFLALIDGRFTDIWGNTELEVLENAKRAIMAAHVRDVGRAVPQCAHLRVIDGGLSA
jgi:hypothetical protein